MYYYKIIITKIDKTNKMSNQHANKVEFTYAVEMTEEDIASVMTEGATVVEVKEEEVEINKNTKEESRIKYQDDVDDDDDDDDDADDDDDDDDSNQIEIDPRYFLMDQFAYAQIAYQQNKSPEAFDNIRIIREKMNTAGITMITK